MTEERYRLAIGRIREMKKETSVNERFRDYFRKMAEFFIMIDELKESLESGSYQAASLAELGYWNKRLYQDILPENYEMSYGNPHSPQNAWERITGRSCVFSMEKCVEQWFMLLRTEQSIWIFSWNF